ncbi:MAG: hypothetical protein A2481_02065 [Candidatus Yonathbacteria bacterium RIFOXYC2_FULL_47_9]|nr:MAG: hypothetical protein A2481_02065 [Candidatus Yonathbacteria bacterium RIFOXYC2_FULL_47_9]
MKFQKDYFLNLKDYDLVKKVRLTLSHGVVHMAPKGKVYGNVLLSYITLPFVISDKLLDAHTNRWECREIARLFLEQGYAVDVIDWTNTTFIPKKNYRFFIDIHNNLERLSPLLPKDCIKVFHATGAHWLFQNTAEYTRLLDLQKRRGVTLTPQRVMPPSHAIEHADVMTLLGNDFTESTYAYAKKKTYRIPLSTTHTYPSPNQKDFDSAKKNFVWFGGSGMVHKGLDLVLETFAAMPEYNLTICGKISNEKDFEDTYRKELYESKNISVVGLIDPGSKEFQKICDDSIALIYPSCSEGQSGAVITIMHAGLIPVVSYQSGVDVADFGKILKENSIEGVKNMVHEIASLSTETLRSMSLDTWKFAQKNHTRATFSEHYKNFIQELLAHHKNHA